MPRSKGNNSNACSGPPCAYCTNSTPSKEAVKCSTCGETAHRYCAGVPMKEFRAISDTSPYTCAMFQKEAHLKTINEMKDTIIALQTEISELQSALSEVSSTREQQADRGSRKDINNHWSDVVRRKPARTRNRSLQREVQHRSSSQRSNPPQQSTSTSSGKERQSPRRARTQLEGARKLWGTHKNTTTGEVKGAISMLASIAADDLAVKRKFKSTVNRERSGRSSVRVVKWWFVLGAEESILKRLEESWDALALPRKWKLEPLYSFTGDGSLQPHESDTNEQSHQSITDQGTGDGVASNSTATQLTQSQGTNTPPSQSPTFISKNATDNNLQGANSNVRFPSRSQIRLF